MDIASAHDLLGGSLAAAQNSVDVFTTSCFSWNGAVPNAATGITYGPLPAGEVVTPARGFKAAISLTAGSTVTATIGYTSVGNINGNAVGNNVLPASPAPKALVVTDTTLGSAWNKTSTILPEFNALGVSPKGFGPAGFLDITGVAPTKTNNGNGEYVIVISHASAVATKYDFLGHCQTGTSGSLTGIHTGQGANFVKAGNQVAPTFDYDQLIDQ